MVRALTSSEYPTMNGENFQIYNVQITGKCIYETSLTLPACPPPPLGMIWSLVTPSRTTFLCKSVQKSFSRHEKHFLEKSPPIGEEWGEDTMLSKLTSLSSLKMAFSQLSQDITTYIMHCVYKFNLYFFQNILNDILVNI